MKTVSDAVGFKSRAIYNLFDRITVGTKIDYAKYQKSCKLCGMDLKGKTIYVISALKFLNLIETRHDSKRLENNSKLLMKYIEIFKFYKQLLYFYLKNRNSFNLDSKAVKQSVASIIFKYIRELEAQGKLQNSYIPSVQNFYRILAKHSAFGLK
ncbi:IS30 family transposase, partial [Mycoplasmopsis bovis]